MHELIYRLIRGLHNVYQPFVRLHHEIFTAVAVYKGTAGDIVMRPVRRKRHRSHDPSARPDGGIQYFLTTVVYDPAVIGF